MNIRKMALVVDDVPTNRDILVDTLSDEFEIIQASNGKDAIDLIDEHNKDLAVILLDLIMPDIDGIEVLSYLERNELVDDIPIFIITSDTDNAIETECLEMGVFDFIKRPFNPITIKHRIKNARKLFNQRYYLQDTVSEQTIQLKNQNEHLKQINEQITDILGNIVEARNIESGAHVKRVREYTKVIARCVMNNYSEYNLTSELVETISSASSLHDIGKISTPDNILLKMGRLNEEEFEIIKQHTVKGADIIKTSMNIWNDEYKNISYQICRWHHEKYDGGGYPDGLVGDVIPISAQIVSLADCFDALTSERVYKKACSVDEAYEMILDGRCGAFSDKMIDCFIKSKEELCNLYAKL